MGDTFDLSGDFRGSIVNIQSKLENAQQTVGEIRSDDEVSKQELQQLIGQLSSALEKVPPEKHDEAEAVAATANTLVEQAKSPQPNRTMLQITGEGLKQAAKNLADITPTILSIATQIVLTVSKLTHP